MPQGKRNWEEKTIKQNNSRPCNGIHSHTPSCKRNVMFITLMPHKSKPLTELFCILIS